MGWNFQWRSATDFPVECPGLAPDRLAGLSADAVARLPARAGREPVVLADLFTIRATDRPADHLEITGEMPNLFGLADRMAGGSLVVRGRVGSYLARGLTAGTVELDGSASDFVGAEMAGGLIRIRGIVGDELGSALPGSRIGMSGGVILLHGSAGDRVGGNLRRGLIAVTGPIGDDPGRRMIAGTIVCLGAVGRRAGSGMKRGSLILMGPTPPEIAPGFRAAGRQSPPFPAIYRKWLNERDFPMPTTDRRWLRYNGDVLERGQGEILVADA